MTYRELNIRVANVRSDTKFKLLFMNGPLPAYFSSK